LQQMKSLLCPSSMRFSLWQKTAEMPVPWSKPISGCRIELSKTDIEFITLRITDAASFYNRPYSKRSPQDSQALGAER
ncbi:MAG: hypothetical protein WBL41_07595, partial [Terracidiphilus sp.]